jgi:hypothetical protein
MYHQSIYSMFLFPNVLYQGYLPMLGGYISFNIYFWVGLIMQICIRIIVTTLLFFAKFYQKYET